MATNSRRQIPLLLSSFLVLFVWSAIDPKDRFTWFLEVTPAILGLSLLVITHRRFTFTPLGYWMIWLHACILIVGGHYTYAEVPLFNWLRDTFHLTRNHYDRVGHVAQGFFPAILAREILIRRSPLQPGKWLFFLTVCVCLAISATYEMIEWIAAVTTGEKADAFLGTQGDCWDTQWDMFLALSGCLAAQLTLGRWHDRQIDAMSQAKRRDFESKSPS